MQRRSFLFSLGAALGGAVFASRTGRWFQQGSGLLVPPADDGRYIELAHYFDLPAGVGWRAEGDFLPVPDGPLIEVHRVRIEKRVVLPSGADRIQPFLEEQVRKVTADTTSALYERFAGPAARRGRWRLLRELGV